MLVFILGLLLFFIPHFTPVLLPGVKSGVVASIGAGRWKGAYALISLAGLILIVFGWIQYRPIAPQVYDPPSWGRHATALLVWISFVLLSLPRSKPGRILVIVKHPMLIGVFYWSAGHLLANGDLASILLFGAFLVFTITSRISERLKGDPNHQFVSYRSDIIALGAGTLLYAVFVLWAHTWLFGVSPLGL